MLVTLLGSQSLQAQKIAGQEFWFTLPRMAPINGNVEGLFLYIVSDYCVDDGLIEIPGLNYTTTFTVDRGAYTRIQIPLNVGGAPVYHDRPGRVENKGIFLKAEFPVVVYAVTYESASVDGEVILPIDMLDNEYVLSSRGVLVSGQLRNTIVATEDSTNVEIDTWNNGGTPVTLNVKLNKGQTYQFSKTSGNCQPDYPRGAYRPCVTLNGTVVKSDRPVAVIGSMDCSGGNECGACENTFITYQPLKRWGTEHVTAQVIARLNPALGTSCNIGGNVNSGDFIEVLGPVGTKVTINDHRGDRTVTINAPAYDNGANYGYGYTFFEVPPTGTNYGFANTVITSDNPVQVTQYPKGWQTDTRGSSDPEAIAVFPTDMWVSSYIFAILTTATTNDNNFVVVIKDVNGSLNQMEFDDGNTTRNLNAIPGTSGWTRIGTSDYYYNRVPSVLATNTLRIYSRSLEPFGIYTASLGQAESYIQNGGDGPILSIPTCPICPVADFVKKEDVCIGVEAEFTDLSDDNDATGSTRITEWVWDYGDGQIDTLTSKTNVKHIYTSPGVYRVTLYVTNNNPNPGPCTIEITKLITVFDGPTADAGPDQTLCFGDAVVIGGTPTGSGGQGALTYNWKPSSGVNNTSNPNPSVKAPATNDYIVEVTDEDMCIQRDTMTITVNPKDSAYIKDPKYVVCKDATVPVEIVVNGGSSSSYTITVSNGSQNVTETNLPSNGGIINVPFNSAFPTGFSVKITSFQANDPDICAVFNVASIPVEVRAFPTPKFRKAEVSICEGAQAREFVDFVGSGPFSFDLDDGTNTTTFNNIVANPYELVVSPTTTTTYTIRNVRYSDDPTCPSTETTTLKVNVLETPNPGDPASISVCKKSDPVDLFPLLGPNADSPGTWSDLDNSSAISGSVFNPSLATDGIYRFGYNVTAGPGCPVQTAIVTVDFNEPPKFKDLVEECSAQLQDYKVKFTAFGGDPSTYTSPDGTFGPGGTFRNFESNQDYPTKSNYTITFDDGNGCGPITITGFKNCGCFTNSGTMSSTLLELCETDMASPTFNNDSVLVKRQTSPSDTLYFVLHEGSGKAILNPIDSFPTPVFGFQAGMSYGVTYYLSPVAGEPTANGGIDYDPQGCVSIGQGAPVKFFQQPTLTAQAVDPDICLGEDAKVMVSFSGATPFQVKAKRTVENDTLTFPGLDPVDTLVITTTATNQYDLFEIGDKYCPSVGSAQQVNITVHEAPDTIPGTLNYTCTRDGEFYTLTVQLSGDAASMRVSPSTAGTIDPSTGVFTSNPIANKTNYSFVFSDDFDCGTFTLADSYHCPCITAAGTIAEPRVEVCSGQIATFTKNTDSIFDPNDDFIFFVYSDFNDPLGSILLTKKTPSFGIQAPLQPGILYYFAMAMGNKNGSGGVDFNDPCLSLTPGSELIFNSLPSATYDGDDGELDNCVGVEFKFPFLLSGRAPFSLTYSENGGPDQNATLNLMPRDTFRTNTSVDATYAFTMVTDANGCSSPMDTTLIADVLPSPSLELTNTNDTTICDGETIELRFKVTFNGRYSFDIYDDITNTVVKSVRNLINGNLVYTQLKATDDFEFRPINLSDNVCTGISTGSKKVFKTDLPVLTFTGASDICENSTTQAAYDITGGIAPFNIRVTGPNNFDQMFNNIPQSGTITLPGNVVGNNTYTAVEVSDSSPNGACNGSGNSVSYTVNPLPVANLISADDVCKGDPIPITIEFIGSGNNFSVVVEDDAFNVYTFTNLPAGENDLEMPPSTANNVVFSLGTVTDELGCSSQGNNTASSIQYDSPSVDFSFNNTNDDCYPLDLEVYPNITTPTNSTCTWTFEEGTVVTGCNDPFTVSLYEVGDLDMRVDVVTQQGCGTSVNFADTIHVRQVPKADFSYNPSEPTNVINTVNFVNTTLNGDRYEWRMDTLANIALTNPQFTFPTTPNRSYWINLTAYTDFGCVDSTRRLLTVLPELEFYIPNTFTPNEDGLNETFKPILTLQQEELSEYQFFIFNRWGEQLFYTEDIHKGWDGMYKGEKVQVGSYFYSIKGKVGYNARILEQRGIINVLK